MASDIATGYLAGIRDMLSETTSTGHGTTDEKEYTVVNMTTIQFVKAKDVQAGDEFVIRNSDGRIQRYITVAEAGGPCSDYGQVHITIRGGTARPMHNGKHTENLRTECWFRETEVEVRRNGTANRNPGGEAPE